MFSLRGSGIQTPAGSGPSVLNSTQSHGSKRRTAIQQAGAVFLMQDFGSAEQSVRHLFPSAAYKKIKFEPVYHIALSLVRHE